MTRAARERIARAIRQAESGTTGRVMVRVVPDAEVEPYELARAEFLRAGLHHGERGNAALILVAPKAKKFAILGDRELHARVGETFWKNVVAEMEPYLARNDLDAGIVHAVARIGSELHAHFATA